MQFYVLFKYQIHILSLSFTNNNLNSR